MEHYNSTVEAKLELVTYINKLKWVGSASFTFPLQNRSSKDVKNVVYSVHFEDTAGNLITSDIAIYPWIIPSKKTKMVIRLSGYDTVGLQFADLSNIQFLQDLGVIDYNATDINDDPTESFLLGLADMYLSNSDLVTAIARIIRVSIESPASLTNLPSEITDN